MSRLFWLATGLVAAATSAQMLGAAPPLPAGFVTYANPIARFALDIPSDWSMAASDYGPLVLGIDAGVSLSAPTTQPQIWVFRHKLEPEAMARRMAHDFGLINAGVTPDVQAVGNGDWLVSCTSNGARGPLTERWLSRRQGTVSFVVGAMMRPAVAAAWSDRVNAILASCRLIDGPPLQPLREPTERAYRLTLPQGWQWSGHIIRAVGVPGWFQWKVVSPDGTSGAFNAPPQLFSVAVPYQPADVVARQMLTAQLAQQLPGLRLEAVRPLPTVGAYFREMIRASGVGAQPLVDRAEADFLATVRGVPIRLRCTVGTFQLDSSPPLGGRGDWQLSVNGAWAPVDGFAELYPVSRGVIASLRTDLVWRANQRELVKTVTAFATEMREVFSDQWDDYIRED